MNELNFKAIEEKWQARWEEAKLFEADDNSLKPKYYVLEMFPYPSGSGLHMGHAWNYTIGDILARFKIMRGFNVLHPMGYDALGLPAENAAILAGEHPEDYTNNSIKRFMNQQKRLGITYDWSRVVNTASPEYYKWDQWIFLKMLEKGLAYQKESAVNWCPKCNTVLANEQVHEGNCWRHEDTPVEIKHLRQWFLKITDYADELYEEIENLDWPFRTKAMQKNWIGKSHGTEIEFGVEGKEKVILIDATHFLIDEEGNVSRELKKYLDSLSNKKIILTNSSFEKHDILFKNLQDYEIFTLENNPNKKDPKYYESVLKKFNLKFNEVICFEHKEDSVKSAESIGIKTILSKGELKQVKSFIDENSTQNSEKWPIFTTRPDTIFGVTFMVVSAQHSKLWDLVTDEQKKDVEEFLKKLKSVSEKDIGDLEKEGVFTGSYAINPANGERVPIYAGNFVVADYGSGMVMAVPAHDKRDYEFAKKYGIEVKEVVEAPEGNSDEIYTGKDGILINSGEFDKMNSKDAIIKITDWLKEKGKGKRVVNFRLRDWGVSRQRYWGTPIPIVYCEKCGAVPIDEKDLPVKLPKDVKFGNGNPLLTNEDWINTKCPKCGGAARRETDTMDTFVNSSWYNLRFTDPKNDKEIFSKKKAKYWNPIDVYVGGAEHACMHLIYFRFYTKFLRDLGLINFGEPAKKLFHQGMLSGEGGVKMSKSKPETCILPEEISNRYGIDTARFFLSGLASPDKNINWSENGIIGSFRFIKKIFEFADNFIEKKDGNELETKLNNIIKNVTEYYGSFQYRKATIELRELFDKMFEKGCSKISYEKFLKILNPICPHITEELWEKIGNKEFISNTSWPEFDEKKLKSVKKEIDVNEKIIENVKNVVDKLMEKREVKKAYLYVLPFEVEKLNIKKISESVGCEVIIYSVKDAKKYDPENKSKKARPGMPGVFVE